MTFRDEVPAGCLSGWRVSRAAMGVLEGAEREAVETHAATCERCRALIDDERASVQAATLEPIPARVLAARRRRWWQASWFKPSLGALGALAAAALVLVVTRAPDGIRAKGALTVTATVVRGDALVGDAALAELPSLVDGDRLRLHLIGGGGRAVRVSSFEDGAWLTLHQGVVAADGTIAMPLRVVAGSETKIRVTSCEVEPDLDRAERETPPADCMTEAHTLVVR